MMTIILCKVLIFLKTRDQRNIDLICGKKTSENEKFFENFFKTLGSKPKPCISGSDAHKFSDYGVFPSEKTTWIKSNPTFEGLKQIIYEPQLRVRIQSHKPEEKNSFLTIDSVRFIDDDSRKVLPSNTIKLNPYLNSIIGGKSSGKSLLLFNIARSIDEEEVLYKDKDLLEKYDAKDSSYDFEVNWSDGFISQKSKNDATEKRKITYIPQLYISKLVDNENDLSNFNKLILDTIKDLDKRINIDGELQNISDIYNDSIVDINKATSELSKLINDLFNEIDVINQLRGNQKKIGEKKSIKAELEKKKKSIDELTSKGELTEEEKEKHDSLTQSKEDNNSSLTNFKNNISILEKYETELQQLVDTFADDVDNIESLINDESEITTGLNTKINNWSETIKKSLKEKLSEIKVGIKVSTTDYNQHISKIEKEIEELDNALVPILTKLSNQQQLTELNNDIKDLKESLNKYEENEKQLSNSKKKFDSYRNNILKEYDKIFNTYMDLINFLMREEIRKIDSIEIVTRLTINKRRFRTNFTELFDNRSHFRNDLELFDTANEIVFNSESYLSLFHDLFLKLIEDKTENFVLKYATLKEAMLRLFENYFEIEFDILYRGDNLMQMSPGKIGLVLVHLYLQFSNAKYPILIDQPEENLDNRTVYEELVGFIREKKIQRQIIIVTHNPNLVVSTDSEQIIVCNQGGQQANKDNKEYLFEYVSGSLEFSQEKDEAKQGILYKMGIREHVCDILEGGEEAFEKREQKYGFA